MLRETYHTSYMYSNLTDESTVFCLRSDTASAIYVLFKLGFLMDANY